jgi:GTP-binding protein Era
LPLARELNDRFDFAATFMVSALKSDGITAIADWCAAHVPQGAYLYPPDQISDLPERLLAAEVTREKLFLQLHKELPYGLSVETEQWETFDNGDIKISQIVLIAREAHKPIVLGKGGSKIRAIGTASRIELEKIFGRKIHLSLFVKVDPGWMNDPAHMAQWGLGPTH